MAEEQKNNSSQCTICDTKNCTVHQVKEEKLCPQCLTMAKILNLA